MNKTIAQQLGITKFPFEIKDDNGNLVYCEDSDGYYWWKKEFDLKRLINGLDFKSEQKKN